jgi:hypothetical protein
MKKTIAIAVAAAFAAASLQAIAQQPVTDKKGDAAKTKGGQAVMTKDVKEKPKPEPMKMKMPEQKAKKEQLPKSSVSTKSGGPVTDKSGKAVNK